MRDYSELLERLHKRIALTDAGSPLQDDLLEATNAIKALLISAQTEPIKLHVDELTEEEIKNLKQKIADSPIVFTSSAEVEPVKRGKWVLKSEAPITGEKYWECSLCGCGSDSFDTVYFTPYCPNCGAKMDEVEDNG